MFESRQTRMVGYLSPVEQRRFMGASAGVLLDKSIQLSGEVYAAMVARGFRGETRLLEEMNMTLRDWLQLAGFLAVAGLAIWIGAR
jgi:energy-coupling factor transporter transmembrane protein EcfT